MLGFLVRSGLGGHDREEPPTAGGGTLVESHTVAGPILWGRRGRQVIRCTTLWGCEPVRSGQTPTGVTQSGRGRCLNTSRAA